MPIDGHNEQRQLVKSTGENDHGKFWPSVRNAVDRIRARVRNLAKDVEWAFGE
jgi:hypothetical protein